MHSPTLGIPQCGVQIIALFHLSHCASRPMVVLCRQAHNVYFDRFPNSPADLRAQPIPHLLKSQTHPFGHKYSDGNRVTEGTWYVIYLSRGPLH